MAGNVDDREPVAINLPARHWVAVLALLDASLREKVMPEWEALKKQGARPDDLAEEKRIALTGPIFARAAIVSALHEAGIITPEANVQHGLDALNAMLRRKEAERDEKS